MMEVLVKTATFLGKEMKIENLNPGDIFKLPDEKTEYHKLEALIFKGEYYFGRNTVISDHRLYTFQPGQLVILVQKWN